MGPFPQGAAGGDWLVLGFPCRELICPPPPPPLFSMSNPSNPISPPVPSSKLYPPLLPFWAFCLTN
jgi:hypothetical protein